MFKDSPEGQTHYQNDGCGELAHNPRPKWEEKFDILFKTPPGNINPAWYPLIKSFIRTHFVNKEEMREKIEGMIPQEGFSMDKNIKITEIPPELIKNMETFRTGFNQALQEVLKEIK